MNLASAAGGGPTQDSRNLLEINVSYLVVKPPVERVQKVVVGALLAVGVHDAVQVGEVPVQIHVVGILAPQQEILAALEIEIRK